MRVRRESGNIEQALRPVELHIDSSEIETEETDAIQCEANSGKK